MIDDIEYEDEMLTTLKCFISKYVTTVSKDWEVLASVLEFVEYDVHDMLLEQGEVENNMYCLFDGVIRKYTVQEQKEYTFSFNFPVSFFTSYFSFANQQKSEMSIQAVTRVKVGFVSVQNMKKLYKLAPNASEIGIKMLELAHQVSVKKEISQNTHTAEDNYRFLLEHNPQLVLEIPNQYIASYLGISPVSLSRIKKKIFNH